MSEQCLCGCVLLLRQHVCAYGASLSHHRLLLVCACVWYPLSHCCSLAGAGLLLFLHSGNLLDSTGSHAAGIASATICLAVLPSAAVYVKGLYEMDASSAAFVTTCWQKRNGAVPGWLKPLTGSAATTTTELLPVLAAACSTPEDDHVLGNAIKHAPQLLRLQDGDGCTVFHHVLKCVVQRGQLGHESAFSTLAQQLQGLLYAGVPLHLPNVEQQTACKTARLVIQRHRADSSGQARREEESFLVQVESLLDVLEKLQAAGTSLQFFTREVDGQQQAVVSACKVLV